ncbi:MAG: 16S rRNA (adenine(1518)-N(6)/adenine(1519)-N(6))-dimethyltransferase RsmA [bacterium]|nr:16S rRNA (adenine(1518)-N(6)/adenine(1519)-N(6))-dimethyltransferase RsmA [bacterium]
MRQKLGQHFLINKSAIQKIVAALNLQPNDTVIEIGPGKGSLTLPLIKICREINCQLIAVEKDPTLAKELGENIQITNHKLQIIEGDALKVLSGIIPNSLFKIQKYKVVGNIPYYITGKLLRVLSELENKPELTILMIQREVAERVCAQQPKMNLLAAAVQFWANPAMLFTLQPSDFSPPPQVESAVIKLALRTAANSSQPDNYYRLIRAVYKQPRKTLFNNLRSGLEIRENELKTALKTLKIDPESRPQNLSLAQLELLTNLLFVSLGKKEL